MEGPSTHGIPSCQWMGLLHACMGIIHNEMRYIHDVAARRSEVITSMDKQNTPMECNMHDVVVRRAEATNDKRFLSNT